MTQSKQQKSNGLLKPVEESREVSINGGQSSKTMENGNTTTVESPRLRDAPAAVAPPPPPPPPLTPLTPLTPSCVDSINWNSATVHSHWADDVIDSPSIVSWDSEIPGEPMAYANEVLGMSWHLPRDGEEMGREAVNNRLRISTSSAARAQTAAILVFCLSGRLIGCQVETSPPFSPSPSPNSPSSSHLLFLQ